MRFDLTTLLIWALRILLPILFFGIYFRLQAPGKKAAKDTRHEHSRLKLLRHRETVKGATVPDSMKNIALKTEAQAPELFVGSSRSSRRDHSGRVDREEKRAPKERKEKKEKREDPSPEITSFTKERMHMESLLNYVAFQSQEKQRVFLAGSGEAAPQSPSKNATAPDAEKVKRDISAAQIEKANDEAQMVLRGAIKVKSADVARNLYDQLTESQVDVSESTFELLIESCVLACDLKGASDFMMKMEAAGFLPQTGIMDKVMDLYTAQTSQEESAEAKVEDEKAQEEAPEEAPVEEEVTPQVPEMPINYMVPNPLAMPLFNWDAIEDSDDDDDDEPPLVSSTKLSSDAPVFVPSFIPGPPDSSAAQGSGWLSATAAEFKPQTADMIYDNGTWTEIDQSEQYRSKGKGKGKSKTKTQDKGEKDTGKGKWKGKTHWEDDYGESDPKSWKPKTEKGQLKWKPKTDS